MTVVQPLRPQTAIARERLSPPWLTPLFAAAAFTGAALLFVVQPMIARLMLPSYGGSSTVWSTSSLFFQVLLLAGYYYAHWSTRRFGTWQPRAHLLLLLVPLIVLPIALPVGAAPGSEASPALWLLRNLALMIGLPFVVLATTGPLLQKWYSWTDNPRSEDPYFLFAASNFGSFGGLLAYPFLIEPALSLDQQQSWWSIAFLVYLVLTASCGLVASRYFRRDARDPAAAEPDQPLGRRRMGRWLAWAFLPSALMLAVTSHVTTDVAPVPLLWVVPLAIYLASFVVAFGRGSRTAPARATQLAVALAVLAATSSALPGPVSSILPEIGIQMLMLGVVGYAAHARLAADRPEPAHLTTFYLVIAVGGALGGVLNGLLAPMLFDRVLEYPLVLLAIPLLLLGVESDHRWWLDRLAGHQVIWGLILLSLAFGGLAFAVLQVRDGQGIPFLAWLSVLLVVFAVAYRLAERTVFLMVTLVLLFGAPMLVKQTQMLDQGRTFFGSYQVTARGDLHLLVHGTTVHGTQFTDERSSEPTMYYARSGPLGAVFESGDFEEVGVIGLGAGTIAAYGEPGMRTTYFEIDPDMVRIANDDRLFSYLRDSRASNRAVVGDGRLKVAEEPPGKFDLLVLDAFSSDAIPVHLLTVEAMETYASRLGPDGVLAVHISNRVFDLEPVLAGAASALGWSVASGLGGFGEGMTASHWVVLTPSAALARDFASLPDWRPLEDRDAVLWTDDFSSILDVLR